jgi:hypothetical protein
VQEGQEPLLPKTEMYGDRQAQTLMRLFDVRISPETGMPRLTGLHFKYLRNAGQQDVRPMNMGYAIPGCLCPHHEDTEISLWRLHKSSNE